MSVGLATLIRIEHSWRCQVAVSYQLVIDCTSPEPLARFWAEALRYVIAPPPSGFDSWDDFYRSIGLPEEELGGGADRIEDPNGEGPSIWFQIVPEKKSIKNRIHIDANARGGRGSSLDTRRERVEAEARGSFLSVPRGCVRSSPRVHTTTRVPQASSSTSAPRTIPRLTDGPMSYWSPEGLESYYEQ
jgi:hypothetical protein